MVKLQAEVLAFGKHKLESFLCFFNSLSKAHVSYFKPAANISKLLNLCH